MEVGAPSQSLITENIIQVENRAKVDKVLNETESKFIPNCSEQDTTIQSEDHCPTEDKLDTIQKTEEKSQELNQPSISREEDKDFILIEDAEKNNDSVRNTAKTCDTETEEIHKKIHLNIQKIENNNNQIKAKTKRNSKRESSTTTIFNDPEALSKLVVQDLGLSAYNQITYPFMLPSPFFLNPQQFMMGYEYSAEGAKHFMYNLNSLPMQSLGFYNPNPMQALLQNQYRQNLLTSSALNASNIQQVILDANRKLNQCNSNDLIFIKDAETRKADTQTETKPKQVKPAKDGKEELPAETKKEQKKIPKNKRKQNFKAKVKAAISEENSEESPESEKDHPVDDGEQIANPEKVIRKRKKYNRTGIILEPVQSEQKRVYEDYVFDIHFEDKVKDNIVETSVGPNFQAQIPDFDLDEEEPERPKRKVKLIWNPDEHPREKIDKYFKMLKDNVGNENLHQERALKLYQKYGMDSNKLLMHMKKNPLYYKNYFEVRSYQSILRQKKSNH